MKYNYINILILLATALILLVPASAAGEYRFDFATQVAGDGSSYTKHWSDTYPPDPKADIIIYSAAYNMSYKRMSAVSFLYVVYDPMNNIVAVEKIDSFKRSYDPNIVYYTLHPQSDWIEGNYRVKILVYDRIDRDAFDEKIISDPFGIGVDPDKYKTFYETGGNAEDIGVLLQLGNPVANAVLNFKIDKSASLYPPDRFLLHDVRFVDNDTERVIGENLKIEVKVDNNYKDDGTIKLAMLVDNSLVSTRDVTVKGLSTSTVTFSAKAGKTGTFKLHFGADTSDMKQRDAELVFSIKNESDATKLDVPKITITGMNLDKEFASPGENVTVSVTANNNGKVGSKTITVYSNRAPVGTSEVYLQYLEEKTVQIPINLESTGINRITVSDAPQLFRNVFVQEAGASAQPNPIVERVTENPLRLSALMVFLVFAGTLYYIRKRLMDEETVIKAEIVSEEAKGKGIFSISDKLSNDLKNLLKRKPRS